MSDLWSMSTGGMANKAHYANFCIFNMEFQADNQPQILKNHPLPYGP